MSMFSTMRFFKALAITILLIAGLVVGYSVWLANLHEHRQNIISEWPTVSGSIISTEKGNNPDADNPYPILTIRFTYIVQGVTYEDSQVFDQDFYKGEEKYSPGKSITIYYNPSSPNEALVDPRVGITFWQELALNWVIGASIAVFALCIYIWGWWVRGK